MPTTRSNFKQETRARLIAEFKAAANKKAFAEGKRISVGTLYRWAQEEPPAAPAAKVIRRPINLDAEVPPPPPAVEDGIHREIEAMRACVSALQPLPHDARERVVQWVVSRMAGQGS